MQGISTVWVLKSTCEMAGIGELLITDALFRASDVERHKR